MSGAFAFLSLVLQWLPAIMKGVPEAIAVFQWGSELVGRMFAEGRDPTQEEWAELNTRTDTLRRLLHSDDA